ncbi:hypothetical protein EJ06DRAFT_401012 [Trichodelitschia bisporula]|uniref:Uncharacterized protein n=1 Tax=Trichodelitschia bisporula TaxID=703511 RepID=A0A6G1HXI5_9PEZI|nr:hypothetical protein EJ06DRAFT_401012 [Trichodelitschia bisporula]
MFQFSMLTADAAAQHGHEFSRARRAGLRRHATVGSAAAPSSVTATPSPSTTPTTTPPAAVRQNPRLLPRSPLSVLNDIRQRSPHAPPAVKRTGPVRASSVRVTMAELRDVPEEGEIEDVDVDVEEEAGVTVTAKEEHHTAAIRSMRHPEDLRLRIPGAFDDHSPPDSPSLTAPPRPPDPITSSPAPRSPAPSLRTPLAPTTPTAYTSPPPAFSPPPAIPTVSASPPPSPRKPRRPRTQYRLAHPPPTTVPLRKTGLIRPRVLLQLQLRTPSGFHKPIFEIVPGSRFAPRTKLAQKLQRHARGRREGVRGDDLVVLRAGDWRHGAEEDEDDDAEVVGVIAADAGAGAGAGVVLLCTDDAVWRATPGGSGVYDLARQASGPATQSARWFIPKAKRRRSGPDEERRFYFTTLLPGTTRHPVVAALSEQQLDVYDSYEVPDQAGGVEMVKTDGGLRDLVVLSAAWVFFAESWSPHFRFPTEEALPCLGPKMRAVSLPLDATKPRPLSLPPRSRAQSAYSCSRSPSPATTVRRGRGERDGSPAAGLTTIRSAPTEPPILVSTQPAPNLTLNTALSASPVPSTERPPRPIPSRARRSWSAGGALGWEWIGWGGGVRGEEVVTPMIVVEGEEGVRVPLELDGSGVTTSPSAEKRDTETRDMETRDMQVQAEEEDETEVDEEPEPPTLVLPTLTLPPPTLSLPHQEPTLPAHRAALSALEGRASANASPTKSAFSGSSDDETARGGRFWRECDRMWEREAVRRGGVERGLRAERASVAVGESARSGFGGRASVAVGAGEGVRGAPGTPRKMGWRERVRARFGRG